MPISHRERGLHWNSKRLDTPSPTPHPYEKNRGITFFWFFWWTCLGNVPPSGDLHGIKKFSQTCSMNMSGKKTTVDGTSKPWNIFPRHVHWTYLGNDPYWLQIGTLTLSTHIHHIPLHHNGYLVWWYSH